MRLLITGGAGFIGSNFVHLLRRERPGWTLSVLDLLTYAGHAANLEPHLGDGSVALHVGDVAEPEVVDQAMRDVDAVVHFAAESHVDRSILGSAAFVRTNVVGTHTLLEAARRLERPMVVVSTDEVYGDLGPHDPAFTESHPIRPSSPYSASKAGGDHLALAFVRTFGADVRVTRCSNNYGPRQFPEKLIPVMIEKIRSGQPCPVYGDGQQIQDWIHVDDHNRGVLAVLESGRKVSTSAETMSDELRSCELGAVIDARPLLEFASDRRDTTAATPWTVRRSKACSAGRAGSGVKAWRRRWRGMKRRRTGSRASAAALPVLQANYGAR